MHIYVYIYCLEQTGTLTEEGLDLWGAVPSNFGYMSIADGPSVQIPKTGRFEAPVRQSCNLTSGPLLIGMSACHSLTLIDGELIGDPLDLKVRLEMVVIVILHLEMIRVKHRMCVVRSMSVLSNFVSNCFLPTDFPTSRVH
jgi:magnesium-transporting ATPase (P-type)